MQAVSTDCRSEQEERKQAEQDEIPGLLREPAAMRPGVPGAISPQGDRQAEQELPGYASDDDQERQGGCSEDPGGGVIRRCTSPQRTPGA